MDKRPTDGHQWCGRCRAPIGHLSEGWACACGWTRRLTRVEILDEETFVGLFGEEYDAGLLAIPATISAVILADHRTQDGRLVEMVAPAWFEIVRKLVADPAFAYQMSPEIWEEMIAAAYKRAGYDEVTLTPRSGDLGRDVIAVKKDLATVRIVNQMKRYSPSRIVTADEVRALYGVMKLDGANKAVLTTTAKFAPRIMKDRLLQTVIPNALELVDGKSLITSLEILAKKSR